MSERTEVQNPLIRYAAEIGWTYFDALILPRTVEALSRAMLGQLMTGRVRATPLIDSNRD